MCERAFVDARAVCACVRLGKQEPRPIGWGGGCQQQNESWVKVFASMAIRACWINVLAFGFGSAGCISNHTLALQQQFVLKDALPKQLKREEQRRPTQKGK